MPLEMSRNMAEHNGTKWVGSRNVLPMAQNTMEHKGTKRYTRAVLNTDPLDLLPPVSVVYSLHASYETHDVPARTLENYHSKWLIEVCFGLGLPKN